MADDSDQPKLCTKKTYAIMFSALLVGCFWRPFREYWETGAVTGLTMGASIGALVIGMIIIFFIGRYANKPEK